jgi:hypothetical protein
MLAPQAAAPPASLHHPPNHHDSAAQAAARADGGPARSSSRLARWSGHGSGGDDSSPLSGAGHEGHGSFAAPQGYAGSAASPAAAEPPQPTPPWAALGRVGPISTDGDGVWPGSTSPASHNRAGPHRLAPLSYQLHQPAAPLMAVGSHGGVAAPPGSRGAGGEGRSEAAAPQPAAWYSSSLFAPTALPTSAQPHQ